MNPGDVVTTCSQAYGIPDRSHPIFPNGAWMTSGQPFLLLEVLHGVAQIMDSELCTWIILENALLPVPESK
jgi:hypothetical protein